MIIRLYDEQDTFLVKERTHLQGEGGGEFGRINVLMFTSAELRDKFGLWLSGCDITDAFELNRGLGKCGDRETDAAIRKNGVARLVADRPELLPCFLGYQETPNGNLLPLMTDGHESRWSLFFEEQGDMTLVENRDGEWRLTSHAELLPGEDGSGRKGFLLNGLRSARKRLTRSESSDDGNKMEKNRPSS